MKWVLREAHITQIRTNLEWAFWRGLECYMVSDTSAEIGPLYRTDLGRACSRGLDGDTRAEIGPYRMRNSAIYSLFLQKIVKHSILTAF